MEREGHESFQNDCEVQASHSLKEQKRRLDIRTSCEKLRDLLPFVNGRLDTASTLELTVSYIGYIKEFLPKHILLKVDKALEENNKESWKKRNHLARSNIHRLRKNTKSLKAKIKDHVLKSPVEHRTPVGQNLQPVTIPHPVRPDYVAQYINRISVLTQGTKPNGPRVPCGKPILLDETAVPRGQMLPVCQNRFPPAVFQSGTTSWLPTISVLLTPNPDFITAPTACQAAQQNTQHTQPYCSPASVDLCFVGPDHANPNSFLQKKGSQDYTPPHQSQAMDPPVHPLADSQCSPLPVAHVERTPSAGSGTQPLVPSLTFETETGCDRSPAPKGGPDLTGSEVLNDTRPSYPNLSSLLNQSDLSSSPLTNTPKAPVVPFWLDSLELATNCSADFSAPLLAMSPWN